MKQTILLLMMMFLFASGCETSDPPLINDKPTLRIVFYDFDRTIPAIHIFQETGGADDVSNKSDQFLLMHLGARKGSVD